MDTIKARNLTEDKGHHSSSHHSIVYHNLTDEKASEYRNMNDELIYRVKTEIKIPVPSNFKNR